MQQSKTLLTIDERGSLETVNSIAICRQGATNGNRKNVSKGSWSTFVDSINVFDCRLSCV